MMAKISTRPLKAAAIAAAVAATPLTIGVVTAAPASASGCSAGVWGGINGWGDCRGIGGQRWQLKVSCTWAGQGLSGVMTGDGHVDVACNWGSARTASIIYL